MRMKTVKKLIASKIVYRGGVVREDSASMDDVADELPENMRENQVMPIGIYTREKIDTIEKTNFVPAVTRLPGGGRKPKFALPYNAMKRRVLEMIKAQNISEMARRSVEEILGRDNVGDAERKAAQDAVRKAVMSIIDDGIKKFSDCEEIVKAEQSAINLENKKITK